MTRPRVAGKDRTTKSKSALQRALDELTLLPREEMMSRVDLKLAAANIERFFDCDKNKDCHNHSEDEQERVSRAVDGYRRYDAARSSATSPNCSDLQPLHQELNVFEVTGTVKWFDASKGYGFIVDDHGGREILLHVTCLRTAGYQTAYEGARIHCEVLRRPKGMQAFRILSMDETNAIHPSALPHRTHVIVEPEGDWERAVVKWFSRVRGFGLLSRGEGTLDIFLHMETLRRFGFAELRPGQVIEVRCGTGSKGVTAAELRHASVRNERSN